MSRRELVIAIDFGTTFSSVAWLLGGTNAALVRQWPGSRLAQDAVPSVMYYDANSMPVGWGYFDEYAKEWSESQAQLVLKQGYLKVEWFKLRLSAAAGQTMLPPLPAGKTVEAVIADFLFALKEHTERNILESMPTQVWNVHVENIQYVLTVPAIWNLGARNTMMQCMLSAGYRIHKPEQLQMISEPEAAALHYASGRRESLGWRKGDYILIIDAGGGTVDLITYVLTCEHPFQVNEAVQGTGGFCGGTFVDTKFRDLVVSKLVELPEKYRHQFADIVQSIMTAWTTTWKIEFGDSRHGLELQIDTGLPRNTELPECGIHLGHIKFSEHELKSVFDPICEEIMTLVSQQMAALSSTHHAHDARVFPMLVGGFGRSTYLKSCLRQYLPTDIQNNICQFTDAWTAVVQGASLSATERMQNGNTIIGGHIARKHYLVAIIQSARGDEHVSLTFPHPITGRSTINGVAIIVKKGQKVAVNETFKQELFRCSTKGSSGLFQTTLYESESDVAPTTLDHSCVPVCQMMSDLNCVPETEFIKKKQGAGPFGGGNTYYEIHFSLCIAVGDGNLGLELIFKNYSYGRQQAVFS